MRGFLDIAWRTNARTDARTSMNPLALIGVAERPKTSKNINGFEENG